MTQPEVVPSTTYAGLAADDVGTSDERTPIVFLHGLTFDRTMWRPTLAELETLDPGRRAIAVDLPGHGESPDASSYALEVTVERIHTAIVDAGLRDPILVGHSASAPWLPCTRRNTRRAGSSWSKAPSSSPRSRRCSDHWSRCFAGPASDGLVVGSRSTHSGSTRWPRMSGHSSRRRAGHDRMSSSATGRISSRERPPSCRTGWPGSSQDAADRPAGHVGRRARAGHRRGSLVGGEPARRSNARLARQRSLSASGAPACLRGTPGSRWVSPPTCRWRR